MTMGDDDEPSESPTRWMKVQTLMQHRGTVEVNMVQSIHGG